MRTTIRDRNNNARQVWLDKLQGTESMIAGAGAGLTSSAVTCPLDVIKTKLQAQGKVIGGRLAYHGLLGSLPRIWQEEGIRGFYRGLGPTLLGYLPTWAIYFSVYDHLKVRLVKRWGETAWSPHIVAAMSGGATSTLVTSPLWVIKTRFMTQNLNAQPEDRYRHTLDALRRIYRTEGILGFYRGLVPSLFGVIHVAVQFPLYEQLKTFYRQRDGPDLPPKTILLCSSLSKLVASVTCYPHEVIRTRLQIQRTRPNRGGQLPVVGGLPYAGVSQTIRALYRDEGLGGFYRGLGVNLIRTIPSTALTILTYELLLRRLTVLTSNPSPPL